MEMEILQGARTVWKRPQMISVCIVNVLKNRNISSKFLSVIVSKE